jgi:hypothetical protein
MIDGYARVLTETQHLGIQVAARIGADDTKHGMVPLSQLRASIGTLATHRDEIVRAINSLPSRL